MLSCSRLIFDGAGRGSRGGALGGSGLDLLDDTLTTRGSFIEFGFDAGLLALDSFLLLIRHITELGLDLCIVCASFFSRIVPIFGSSGKLGFNQGLLLIKLTLLLFLTSLATLLGLQVVSLGTLGDRVELLSLTLLSSGHALLDRLSSTLLGSLLS